MSEQQIVSTAPLVEHYVTPEVPDDIFETHQQARFWVGRVATMGVVKYPEYYDGVAELRGSVYVELDFIKPEDLDELGRDINEDDKRSVDFAVLEQIGKDPDEREARVVGSGRLIVKYDADEKLPIEKYFPELFVDKPVPEGMVEVSRFISRHEDPMTQHKVALAVIRAMTHYSVENDIRDAYFIVEKPLIDLFKFIGLPINVMAESKDIPEYGGILYPVNIKPFEIIDSVEQDKSGTLGLKQFFANRDGHAGDEAFYTDTLMDEA